MESIITLTEEIMGWTERTVADHEGRGLGGGLKWLRGKARTATLHEARQMLAASVGVEPPVPVKKLVRQATQQQVVVRKKKASRVPIFIAVAGMLVALALAGYWLIKRNDAANAANAAWPVQPSLEVIAATQSLTPESPSSLFEVGDRELLLEKKNAEVQLAGRLADVHFSDNGKGATLYLEFSKPAAKDEPRGYILRKDLTAEMNLESLQKFIGKKVTLRGKVNTPSSKRRPEIEIKNLAAIQEVP